MSNSIATHMNDNLKALFDINDEQYKIIYSNPEGTIPSTINRPDDIDIGAVASAIEYLRRLSIDMVKQLFYDEATGEFFKYISEKFFNTVRLENETNEQMVDRVVAKLFQPKLSKAAIIVALRPYSSIDPTVTELLGEAPFAGLTFASRYTSYSAAYGTGGPVQKVFPAIARSFSFSLYSIRISMYDVDTDNIYTIIETINRIIAAGITYELALLTT